MLQLFYINMMNQVSVLSTILVLFMIVQSFASINVNQQNHNKIGALRSGRQERNIYDGGLFNVDYNYHPSTNRGPAGPPGIVGIHGPMGHRGPSGAWISPTPQYIHMTALTTTDDIEENDHIKFNNAESENGDCIILDSTTSYTVTENVDSVGRILLTAGKTYELIGSLAFIRENTANPAVSVVFSWYNSDTGVRLDGVKGSLITGGIAFIADAVAQSVVVADIDMRVELRIEDIRNAVQIGSEDFGLSWAKIRAIA